MSLTPSDLGVLAERHRETLDRLRAEDAAAAEARRRRIGRWPGARSQPPRPLPDAGLMAAIHGGGQATAAGRVLVIRPDHLGDVLFAGPALSRLREAVPGAAVTFLVGPWSKMVAERLGGGAEVRTLNFPYFNRLAEPAWRRYGRLLLGAWQVRRWGPFAAALVLRDDDWASAWLCRMARIPHVVGHQDALVDRFTDFILPAAARPSHTAGANLALVEAAVTDHRPGPQARLDDPGPLWNRHPLTFRLKPDDHERAAALLARAGLGSGAVPIAIHPGAGAALKRWEAAKWVQVARAVAGEGVPVVLTGGPGEGALAEEIVAGGPSGRQWLNLAERTDLGTLGALLSRCRLVMGPDSGPLHLAVAVGAPTVHLYGPADPLRFGPWGSPGRHRVVMSPMACAPCGRLDWSAIDAHPCVRAIPVPAVIDAARAVLAGE